MLRNGLKLLGEILIDGVVVVGAVILCFGFAYAIGRFFAWLI